MLTHRIHITLSCRSCKSCRSCRSCKLFVQCWLCG